MTFLIIFLFHITSAHLDQLRHEQYIYTYIYKTKYIVYINNHTLFCGKNYFILVFICTLVNDTFGIQKISVERMQSKIFSQSVILNQVLWLDYESGTISGINIFNNRQRKALENKSKN